MRVSEKEIILHWMNRVGRRSGNTVLAGFLVVKNEIGCLQSDQDVDYLGNGAGAEDCINKVPVQREKKPIETTDNYQDEGNHMKCFHGNILLQIIPKNSTFIYYYCIRDCFTIQNLKVSIFSLKTRRFLVRCLKLRYCGHFNPS